MDKINVVSSQAVLKMSFFNMDTRSMSSSPLVNSLVKNRLFKTAPDIDEPPFQFIRTMDLSLADTTLHDSPLLLQPFSRKLISFFTPYPRYPFEQCKFLIKILSSSLDPIILHSRHCKQHCKLNDVIMTSWSSIEEDIKMYYQNFLLCNSNEIPHALQIYSTVSAKKCTWLHFFEVMQQQTIGEVANSITYLWADNFWLQQWKNY